MTEMSYRQISNISHTSVGNAIVYCRRCFKYTFILDLTPGLNGSDKNNCESRRETFKCWDLVCPILDTWLYYETNQQMDDPRIEELSDLNSLNISRQQDSWGISQALLNIFSGLQIIPYVIYFISTLFQMNKFTLPEMY